jgi:hypothetical protein
VFCFQRLNPTVSSPAKAGDETVGEIELLESERIASTPMCST